MTAEQGTPLEIVYSGNQVDDGTIPVEDMIDALAGFYGAYEKVASGDQTSSHQIRVVGLKPGSTRILLDAFQFAKEQPATAMAASAMATVVLNATGKAITVAYRIVKDIAAVISAKKELKGESPPTNPLIEGQLVRVLPHILLTKDQFELLVSKRLDNDLHRIAAPLREGGIQRVELKAEEEILASINESEKLYFDNASADISTTEHDTWVRGKLHSLTKDSYRGTFYAEDGSHIPYQYVGNDHVGLLDAFRHRGLVRVLGHVKFDSERKPIHLQITAVERVQLDLDLDSESSELTHGKASRKLSTRVRR